MKQSLAIHKVEFPHNSVQGFRDVLLGILDNNILVRQGKRSILVAVESIYSMYGDVCPLEELVQVASETSRGYGNIQLIVDEGHSIGIVGRDGAGLVCHYGLEKDVAVVIHSFGKAMGATGGSFQILVSFQRQYAYQIARRNGCRHQNGHHCIGELWGVNHIHNITIVSICYRNQSCVPFAKNRTSPICELYFRPANLSARMFTVAIGS